MLLWLRRIEQSHRILYRLVSIPIFVIVAYLGATFAFGSIIAINFERTGFGGRQGNLYLLQYVLLFIASLVIPILLGYILFPQSAKRWWIISLAIIILGALSIFGILLF